jgi:hypothetical protein
MAFLSYAALVGIGATAFMDVVALARHRLFGAPMPDYGMAGRWFAYMPRGKFLHDRIAAAAPLPGEKWIGWSAHYLVGVAFAALLLFICGVEWLGGPTLAPALALGLATVGFPFLLMHPGMGAGIASRRTPDPRAARIRSLVAHATFGVGLYAAGWAVRIFLPAN